MTESLAGKVVLVTGAARGIGAEVARRLGRRGARLGLIGMEPERLETLSRELGEGHHWQPCDVTRQDELEDAVAGVVRALGGIDVVVANAGIGSHGTVSVAPVEALVRVLDVNLAGVVRTVSATLPHVTERRGYYLLVSSAAAFTALPGMSTYAASKAGVAHFGNVLRLEVAHVGVGVGVAHPSWVATDLVRDVQMEIPSFNEALRKLPGPFGRVTSLDECADAFVRAIERRQRTVYVPRSLAWLAAIRQLFTSRVADGVLTRHGAASIPAVEGEVRALGRSFGASSVGMGGRATDTSARPAAAAPGEGGGASTTEDGREAPPGNTRR